MTSTLDILLLKEAVATTALENGWTKEQQDKAFTDGLNQMIFEEYGYFPDTARWFKKEENVTA